MCIYVNAFRQGYRCMAAILQVKLAYLKCLPMLFAGNCVEDDDAARRNAFNARNAFRESPQTEALRNPRVWRLMQPGSGFS